MTENYKQKVKVIASPDKAFNAITKELDKWWGQVDVPVNGVGDIFTITFGEAFWTFKISEFIIDKTVTWECIDGQPELNNEWIGHHLKWTIEENNDSITISFDQDGLNGMLPCYDICSTAWDRFILYSLKEYLETGKGKPGS